MSVRARLVPQSVPQLAEADLAWAAGLFEGEGSVRINKPARRNWGSLTASVVNTDREIVDFFQDRWPGYCKAATGLRPEQRPAWVWVIAARQAAAFLEAIRPFVRSTRVRTKIAYGLEFQAQKLSGLACRTQAYCEVQWNAYWWMAELNARGRQPPARTSPHSAEHRRTA